MITQPVIFRKDILKRSYDSYIIKEHIVIEHEKPGKRFNNKITNIIFNLKINSNLTINSSRTIQKKATQNMQY